MRLGLRLKKLVLQKSQVLADLLTGIKHADFVSVLNE
jgi:hypothetical protein